MKIVITAGGTSEYIDTVRKITNSSSGRLGSMIAEVLADKNEIWYIHTPKAVMPALKDGIFHDITVTGTLDLKRAVEDVLISNEIDWFIHSMAVSDYVVESVTTAQLLAESLKANGISEKAILENHKTLNRLDKISSDEESLILTLKKAPKIISMIKTLSPDTKLIGFKLLSHTTPHELIAVAHKLLEKNGCEFVVANDLQQITADQHIAFFVGKDGKFDRAYTKAEIAEKIKKYVS